MLERCQVFPGRWVLLVAACVAGCRLQSDLAGSDAAPPAASAPDAGAPDAAAADGSTPDASVPDAALPDAGPSRRAGDAAADCAEGSDYTLVMSGEEGVDPDHVERMRCTFFEIYPQLARRFNPEAPTTVGMIFTDEPGPGAAWAFNGNTYYSRSFLADFPLDSDVVVHETMHIVQGGYTGEVPGWIIEGMADYVRDVYGLHNQDHGWALPVGWVYGPYYTDGYRETAAFMKWIDATYREGRAPVADALDDLLREGRYSSETFVELTGLDLDALWYEYSDERAPRPARSGVTLFEDIDYAGRAFTLAPGSYDTIDLQARGLSGSISSLRVPRGRTVRAFVDAGFSGEGAVFTSDTAFVEDLNDLISSLIVD